MDNPNLSDSAKEHLATELEKTNVKISKLSDEAEAVTSSLPEKEQSEALELQQKISDIESSLEDENVSEGTKQSLMKESEKLQDQLDVLVGAASIIKENTPEEAPQTEENLQRYTDTVNGEVTDEQVPTEQVIEPPVEEATTEMQGIGDGSLENGTVKVKSFKKGDGGTKGIFEDETGKLYKSTERTKVVLNPETNQYERQVIPGSKTNEYDILSELQGNPNIPKIGKAVETSEGKAFEIEKLNEIENLTKEEFSKVEEILADLNSKGYFVNDVVTVMRRPKTGEIVVVDFSSGMKDESLIGNYSYKDNVLWQVEEKLSTKDKDLIKLERIGKIRKQEAEDFLEDAVPNQYILTQRPPSIGTHPTDGLKSVEEIEFNKRTAWKLTYDKPLSEKEIYSYELREPLDEKALLGEIVTHRVAGDFVIDNVADNVITLTRIVDGKEESENISAKEFQNNLKVGRYKFKNNSSNEQAPTATEATEQPIADLPEVSGETVTPVVEETAQVAEVAPEATQEPVSESEPQTKQEKPKGVSEEFHQLATKNIESQESRETLSNILNVSDYDLSDENKRYNTKKDVDSANHGDAVIAMAKEEFGDNYVEDTVDYLDTAKMSQDKRSLIYIALELDLEKQLSADPDNLTLKKKLDWLRGIVIKEQRSAALAIGHGRLRNIIKYGFDRDAFFDDFYNPKQREGKKKIEEAIQADSETIQKEAEELAKQDLQSNEELEDAISRGVDAKLEEIYKKLPSKRREKADKAIAALDKIQKSLRSKTYDASIGVPVAIIDAGITTIKAAIKAGVTIADAIELGINKIKEKHGQDWGKESEFRQDMLDGFNGEGIDTNEGRKLLTEEQKINIAIKATERSIANLEDRIKNNKLEPDRKTESLWTEELGKLKQKQLELRNELDQKIKEAQPVKETQPLTAQERLENAKENVRKRMEEIRQEIINKERNLNSQKKPIKDDAELTRLRAEEESLKSIRDKYLPKQTVDPTEAKVQAQSKRIMSEIEEINRQIKSGEKDAKEGKPNPVSDARLTKLKAEKAARFAVLEYIDPTPKETINNALIEAGYGKEITVSTKQGKVKKQVIDWRKLAGKEGSVDNIRNNVESHLKGKGYSDIDIERIQDGFVDEYNNLRASIIQKAQNELNKGNIPRPPVDGKTSAKRLAELYNYGLFDKEADTYDYLVNSALGINEFNQELFKELKQSAKALSTLYSTKHSELALSHGIRNITRDITSILSRKAIKEGGYGFKVAMGMSEISGLMMRNMLHSLRQILDNPISGLTQRAFNKVGFAFNKTGTKELREANSELQKAIYKDINLNGGLNFGEVSSPYISRSQLVEKLDRVSKNKIYHAALTLMLGKNHLDAADSYHKADQATLYFRNNMIKLATLDGKYTKDEAIHILNEKLTGQNLEDAKVVAKEIIEKVNSEAGREIIPNTKESITRMAHDVAKESLASGFKMDINTIEKAYKAAIRGAGYDLGHEPNNPVSRLVADASAANDRRIKQAIKDGDYHEATVQLGMQIIHRAILNPFVGGGMNWRILKLQKLGLDVVSPLVNFYRSSKSELDLTSNDGLKNVGEVLYKQNAARSATTRAVIGGMATLLVYAASRREEDKFKSLSKWLDENPELAKYIKTVSPEALSLSLSLMARRYGDSDKFKKYISSLFVDPRTSSHQESSMVKFIRGTMQVFDERRAIQSKGYGAIGESIGDMFSAPLVPYRTVNDIVKIGKERAGIETKPKATSTDFWSGLFKTGIVEAAGFRPLPDGVDEKAGEIKMIIGIDETHKDEVIYELNEEQIAEKKALINQFNSLHRKDYESALSTKYDKEKVDKMIDKAALNWARGMMMQKYANADGTLKLKEVSRKEKD